MIEIVKCEKCNKVWLKGWDKCPECLCSLSAVASEAQPAQPVSPSATGCPDARAEGNQEADSSARCPDGSVSAAAFYNEAARAHLILQKAGFAIGLRGDPIADDIQDANDSITRLLYAMGMRKPPTLPAQRERASQGNGLAER